jgi:hypothetical protein
MTGHAAVLRLPVSRRYHDDVISRVEERVAIWTKYNVSHQEDIQVNGKEAVLRLCCDSTLLRL